MMSTTWYLINKRSGDIVNAVSTSKPGTPDLSVFGPQVDAFYYDLVEEDRVPLATLERYRFWAERP